MVAGDAAESIIGPIAGNRVACIPLLNINGWAVAGSGLGGGLGSGFPAFSGVFGGAVSTVASLYGGAGLGLASANLIDGLSPPLSA